MNKLIITAALWLLNVYVLPAQQLELQKANNVVPDKSGKPMLLGPCVITDFSQQPFSQWYLANHQSFIPDSLYCDSIAPLLQGYHFALFFGTWCGDSKREVPRMVKLLQHCGIDSSKIELVALSNYDSLYKQSPGHEERGKNIVRVPTLIAYKNGHEIGRIIESPVETLEKDLLNILLARAYKPHYADRVVAGR